MGRPKKIRYEDKVDVIDGELKKRKHKWHLNAVAWFGFEDVEQIIRFHIFKKWDQWDQKRPLEPWVNKIISNQLKNIFLKNENLVAPSKITELNKDQLLYLLQSLIFFESSLQKNIPLNSKLQLEVVLDVFK